MTSPPMSAERVAWLEQWLVIGVAAHTFAVGFGLVFLTGWVVPFGGWEEVTPRFFVRQGGVFHFVVVTGYLLEYFRYHGVTLIIATKAIAFVFLTVMTFVEPGAWIVPFSAVVDGLMGAAVFLVRRRLRELGTAPV